LHGIVASYQDAGGGTVEICTVAGARIEANTLAREMTDKEATKAAEIYLSGTVRPPVGTAAPAPDADFCSGASGTVTPLTDPSGQAVEFCRFSDGSSIGVATLFAGGVSASQWALAKALLPQHPRVPTPPPAGETKLTCHSREGAFLPALALEGQLTVAAADTAEAPVSGALDAKTSDGTSVALDGHFDIQGTASFDGGLIFHLNLQNDAHVTAIVIDLAAIPGRSPYEEAVRSYVDLEGGRRVFLDCETGGP
jgi:putative hemolysin